MTDRVYFNIVPGTPAANTIATWNASINDHLKWVKEFQKRHGLEDAICVGYEYVVYGLSPKMPKEGLFYREYQKVWSDWIAAHPLWRRVKPGRGTEYAVPRKDRAAAKALAKEWKDRPGVLSGEWVSATMTQVPWVGWLDGNRRYFAGWITREDGSTLFRVPYFVTQRKEWKPLKGLKKGNQTKLTQEWHGVKA